MERSRQGRRSGPVALAALFALVSLMVFGATPKPQRGRAGIEPLLLERAAGGGEVTFWVVLRERADLRPAYAMNDWVARGRFVADRLQATAHASQAELRRWLRGRGLVHQPFWISNVVRVRGDRVAIEEVSLRAEVEAIVADKEYHIPLPMPASAEAPIQTVEWNIAKIRADQVWSAFGNTGQGIVVANIDTGVDPTHVALESQYRGHLGGGSFDHNYNWFDPSRICSPGGDIPCDNIGHGTHTMGTMVGGDGPGPLADDIGVAPGARWIAAKGCEFNSCSLFALLESGQWVLAPTDLNGSNPRPDLRPHVVNNSWGGPTDPFYLTTVQAWRASGIFPAFANGNNAFVCGGVGSPGDYLESFGVGATDIFDLSPAFSNRGPSQSVPGLIKPDASAPGDSVRSSVPGNGYAVFSGTSMATPHVAGTVALIWAVAPSLVGDIEATFGLIKSTAVDRPDLSCGGDFTDGDPNNVYGEGRIDALAAVSASPHTAGTLEGSVVEAASGVAIGGATVTAVRRDDGLTRSVATDAAGAYRLLLPVDPAPGPELYDAAASAFGYQTQGASGIEIRQDITTSQGFALAPAPRFTVSGTVRDEEGGPVTGATVSVVGTPLAPALTDAAGYYTIPGVPAGDYELRAEAGGCNAPASSSVSVSSDLVIDFTLPARRDAFGYRCEVIPIDWIDPVPALPLTGDDSVVEVTLPFSFSLYAVDHSTAYVATNGYLSLRSPSAIYENTPIPDPLDPNGTLYPFWDDLIVDFDSAVRAETLGVFPDRIWVLEWENVGFYADPSNRINFEVKLYERDGSVEFLYRSMPGMGDGSSATVGIENGSGTDAFQYSFMEPVIRDGLAVRFTPPPPGPSVTLLATTNEGELLEVDYGSGAARLLGDAGVWNGRNLGWSGLSLDAAGNLYVTSRHASEDPADGCVGFYGLGPCSHLYVVDPSDGSVLREVGSTHVAFLSDIDFALDGTLNGAYYLDENPAGDGALVKIDPNTAQVVFSGAFGGLENGGLSVHPLTGEIWSVESTFSQSPSLFKVNPSTGAAIPPILRLGLNGQPTPFGLDALEILPDGRFVGLRGGIGFVEMYEIAPFANPASGLAELTRRALDLEPGIAGKPNGLETLSVTLPAFGFVAGRVTDAFDGAALAGARVTALENGRTVTTDALGAYRMQLPAGLHTLEATLAPYASERARVTVLEGQLSVQDFALRSGRASISPASLDFVVLPDRTRGKRLTLSNSGLADLSFEVQERSVAAARSGSSPPVPEGVDSRTPPPDNSPKPSSTVLAGGPVLVFMDLFPWGVDSLFQVLSANNIPFDFATSDLMGTIDLSAYEVIFLSSDQPQPFYDSYNARRSRFVDYVQRGGLLWVGAAAWGYNGGDFNGGVLPGGMTVSGVVYETENDVLDPSHPTMQGVPDPFSGTGASHAVFQNLPAGAHVIARGAQSGQPTLVEYDLGAGRVLAFGQTLEFGFYYGQDAGRILENGVPYAYTFEPQLDVPWLSVDPVSGSVSPGGSLELQVSVDTTGLTPGFYRARLALSTSDPRNPEIQVPVTLLVPAYQQAVDAGDGPYTDLEGDVWSKDQVYSAGSWGYRNNRSRTKSTRQAIIGTADDRLYQSLRTLPGEYRFDGLPPGVYQFELRFAEVSNVMPGNRIFDVTIEGGLVLFAHDIAEEVGSFAADDHSFLIAVTDGQANVRFIERRGYSGPIVNAVRVTHRPDR